MLSTCWTSSLFLPCSALNSNTRSASALVDEIHARGVLGPHRSSRKSKSGRSHLFAEPDAPRTPVPFRSWGLVERRNWLRFAKTSPVSALQLWRLPKAHAWSTTVLVDELHAGCFECAFDDVESCPSRLTSPVFKLVDGNSSHSRLSGQILLAPS
jgi:hypothetical protein